MIFEIGDYVLLHSDKGDDVEEFRLKQVIEIDGIHEEPHSITCDNGMRYHPRDIRCLMLESEAYVVINQFGSPAAIRMLIQHLPE